jgi:hypothetical protein
MSIRDVVGGACGSSCSELAERLYPPNEGVRNWDLLKSRSSMDRGAK